MEDDYSIPCDRSRRKNTKLAHFIDSEGLVAYALIVTEEIPEGVEPSTYTESISCMSSSNWLLAMQQEMEIWHKNQTCDLCELPKGWRALTVKWIYKIKEGIPRVEKVRWKARLVVRGCNQKEGIGHNKVFSPIVCHTFIRVLLAFVALFEMDLEHLEVKTAFLHGELEEEIYMKQPEGFVILGKEQLVCRLKKSLYELGFTVVTRVTVVVTPQTRTQMMVRLM